MITTAPPASPDHHIHQQRHRAAATDTVMTLRVSDTDAPGDPAWADRVELLAALLMELWDHRQRLDDAVTDREVGAA